MAGYGKRLVDGSVIRRRMDEKDERIRRETAARQRKQDKAMSDKYILAPDGKTPIPCPDLMTWAKAFESLTRVVAKDATGDVEVSTVFLGTDHAFGQGPPLLWETMIFDGEHDGWQDRYSSHEDAVAGHARALAMVKGEVAL